MFPRGKEGIKCISDTNVNFSVCPGSPICPESLNSLPRKDGTLLFSTAGSKYALLLSCLACFFFIFPSALFLFSFFYCSSSCVLFCFFSRFVRWFEGGLPFLSCKGIVVQDMCVRLFHRFSVSCRFLS